MHSGVLFIAMYVISHFNNHLAGFVTSTLRTALFRFKGDGRSNTTACCQHVHVHTDQINSILQSTVP